MTKILRCCFFAVIILLFEGNIKAQCNANFNYNINLNTVNCYPQDSIAGAMDSWSIQKDSLTNYSYTGYDFNYSV